ncbi:MAG: sugar phosphate nucleotidyltransferase [Bacteroidetes bacterium]|nr:sugar phosphate nucleotidyltransferase [Bacteroidota bacterium]
MNKAVIMAGGFGTRLRPLSASLPKPMVPIVNRPMLEHIIELLKSYNIVDIVCVLYYQPEVITSYFEDGTKFGVNIKYVLANADYGTAGAVKNAFEYLNTRFIVISGDVLTDFNLFSALDFHIQKESKATILLTRVSEPLQYGIVITDEKGNISSFLEKPSWGQVFSDTINTGIYILEPEVLDLIPYHEEFDFSKDLFPNMLSQKMPLYGHIADGYWKDIGNLNEYQSGQKDALNGEVNLKIKGITKANYIIGENTKIAPSAVLKGTVIIDEGVTIGEHATLINCIIGKNVSIGNGSKLSGVTLWENVEVADFAELTDDVVCNDCYIGDNATIHENVFIAENCIIGNNATLMSNIKLWPNKHIEEGATLSRSMVQEEKWIRELFTDARISGLSNIEINPEFGAKLGAAIAMTFGKNSILIASRDPDIVSRIMKRTITAGISSVGVNVNDLQTVSIPQTRQELRTGKYAGGFHVRRSPRNPDKTDIIIFNKEGRDIQIARTKAIERYFFGEEIKRVHYDSVGNINYPERTNEIYINRFLESLKKERIIEKKFKILVDYSFGLASTIMPYILGKLNVEALSLHDYVDATRYQPDPTMTKPGSDESEKVMKALGYGLGFKIEPGAEKVGLIDERGVFYNPLRLLTIITKLFLETHRDREPYKIAVSVFASNEIELTAKGFDVEVIRIKNSHSAMMEATREKNMLFVGGIWGGFIFSDFLFASDGMFTIGKLLEMLAVSGMSISELDAALPKRYQHHISISCPWSYKGSVMRKAMEHSEKLDRELIEGVKLNVDGDSVLLVPDKERAAFDVIAESDDYENAVVLGKKYSNFISQWREDR